MNNEKLNTVIATPDEKLNTYYNSGKIPKLEQTPFDIECHNTLKINRISEFKLDKDGNRKRNTGIKFKCMRIVRRKYRPHHKKTFVRNLDQLGWNKITGNISNVHMGCVRCTLNIEPWIDVNDGFYKTAILQNKRKTPTLVTLCQLCYAENSKSRITARKINSNIPICNSCYKNINI